MFQHTDLTAIPRRKPEPEPFRREPLHQGNKFLRLCAAQVKAQLSGAPLSFVVNKSWPNDRALELIARAASAPAMTTVTGWADELAAAVVADALEALGPMSAGALLLGDGLVLNFDEGGVITVPGFVATAASAGFVAEGQPIPVRQLVAAAGSLEPYKLASICALTQEMADSSNAEKLIGDALMRSAGLALDAVLFDANAATAARPAGLLNGITPITASNNTTMSEAFFEDMAALLKAVSPVGGTGPYAFIAPPALAVSMRLRMDPGLSDVFPIYGSVAVTDKVIAVAVNALVSAFSPNPEIVTSNAATLVMDDTAPALPDTTQPTKSMLQTASLAVKMRWPVSWDLRDARGLAFVVPNWK